MYGLPTIRPSGPDPTLHLREDEWKMSAEVLRSGVARTQGCANDDIGGIEEDTKLTTMFLISDGEEKAVWWMTKF